MFVVGISGARPKTRAFVTERTWADQTKSAFSDAAAIAGGAFGRNRKGAIDQVPGKAARLVPEQVGLMREAEATPTLPPGAIRFYALAHERRGD